MSTAALAFALKQRIKPSSLKFLYVACADVTPEGGLCFPSVDHLVEITCQDRKTVLAGLQKLQEAGKLLDTGKRTGATKQIVVYELVGFSKRTENGTVKPGLTVPKTDGKGPVLPGETVPKTGHGTPSLELQGNRTRAAAMPEDFKLEGERQEFAASKGLSVEEAKREWEQFVDHHTARGSTFKDWNAAWRTWVRNFLKFNKKDRTASAHRGHGDFPD